MSRLKTTLNLLLMGTLAGSMSVLPSVADSQARIVRLSDVQGEVEIDRNTGVGYEKAFLNLPVNQGVKIQTKGHGRATVEFEDGGTLGIAADSVVEFTQLALRDSGVKLSTIAVQEGTVYVNFAAVKDNEFSLTFERQKITLTEPAHVRLSMGDVDAKLAVFKGNIQVGAPSGTTEVGKNQTVTFDLTEQNQPKVAKGVAPDPYDAWDKEQDQYEQRYTKSAYNSYSPYAYGVSDLNYYGNFFNAPGYGTLWQPYFIGAGWDPFMSGAWAFYPGFGYSWVSGYPWGWTPYHYGSWVFLSPYGWAWQPGGSWAGLSGIPVVSNPPANFRSPQAPGTPGQRLVPVNRGQIGNSLGSNRLEVRNNSAGLGIPRGGVTNLRDLSQTVEKKGFATTRLQTAPIGLPPRGGYGYGGPGARMGGTASRPSSPMGPSLSPARRAGAGGGRAVPK